MGRLRILAWQALSIAVLVAAWEAAVRAGIVDTLFVPAPSAVARALGGLAGEAVQRLGDTLLKTVIAPLREMMRVTQTGGFVAVGIPNLSSLLSRVYLLLGRDPVCLAFPGPHVRGLTHRSFGRMLRSNPNLSLEAATGALFYPVPPRLVRETG